MAVAVGGMLDDLLGIWLVGWKVAERVDQSDAKMVLESVSKLVVLMEILMGEQLADVRNFSKVAMLAVIKVVLTAEMKVVYLVVKSEVNSN